jgi:predicted component of type VI protein secretion system
VLVDYGLGDYDDPTRIKGDVDLLAREIQATVAVYEPRISGPQVKAVARDPRRRIDYELTGTVAGEPRTIRIAFDARSRTVTVKEA